MLTKESPSVVTVTLDLREGLGESVAMVTPGKVTNPKHDQLYIVRYDTLSREDYIPNSGQLQIQDIISCLIMPPERMSLPKMSGSEKQWMYPGSRFSPTGQWSIRGQEATQK